MQDPKLPSGYDKQEYDVLACSNCGCSWKAGINESAQVYCAAIVKLGHGLVVVPDCDGKCGCHTGRAPLPYIKVSMRWRKKMDEAIEDAMKRLAPRGTFN